MHVLGWVVVVHVGWRFLVQTQLAPLNVFCLLSCPRLAFSNCSNLILPSKELYGMSVNVQVCLSFWILILWIVNFLGSKCFWFMWGGFGSSPNISLNWMKNGWFDSFPGLRSPQWPQGHLFPSYFVFCSFFCHRNQFDSSFTTYKNLLFGLPLFFLLGNRKRETESFIGNWYQTFSIELILLYLQDI